MNWAGVPAYRCVELTLQTVHDLLAQDVPTQVVVMDNSPDDVLHDALCATGDPRVNIIHNERNVGVGPAWNQICEFVFGLHGAEHVLITNNDVRLRPDTYRHLLIPNGGFITAVNAPQHFEVSELHVDPEPMMKGGPDFSCFLIKKPFYEAIGGFPTCYFPGWFEDNETHWIAKCKGLDSQIFSVPVPYTPADGPL